MDIRMGGVTCLPFELRRRNPIEQLALQYGLPYAHLNLRFNPFSELDLIERRKIVMVNIESYIPLLQKPGFAIQFIGDIGHGKTSHLLAIWNHFPNASYLHVNEGERPLIPEGDPLIIDEIQRIPRKERQKLFRRAVSFVLGTHLDYSREMIDSGLKVKSISVSGILMVADLQHIFQNRVEHARRSPGAVPVITEEAVLNLRKRFGDDIRSMEWALYDTFQILREIGHVKM